MKQLLYALRFLTILPLPYAQGEDMKKVASSLTFFPLVGAILGLGLWGGAELFDLVFSPLTTGFFLMILSIILTGGLHLDGLSDLADGLGGGSDREKRLEIMKDSRIGAFGALTLIAFLIGKGLLLGELWVDLRISQTTYLLIIPPLWARSFGVIMIKTFPTARPDGMGDFFQKNASKTSLILALAMALGATFFLLSWQGLILFLLTVVFMMLPALSIHSQLKGLTGDCYGALIEGAELATLLALVISLRLGLL